MSGYGWQIGARNGRYISAGGPLGVFSTASTGSVTMGLSATVLQNSYQFRNKAILGFPHGLGSVSFNDSVQHWSRRTAWTGQMGNHMELSAFLACYKHQNNFSHSVVLAFAVMSSQCWHRINICSHYSWALSALLSNFAFFSAASCPADTSTSNIVPIAVGAALGALVLIVLIAYLIGRSKNKRGYESV